MPTLDIEPSLPTAFVSSSLPWVSDSYAVGVYETRSCRSSCPPRIWQRKTVNEKCFIPSGFESWSRISQSRADFQAAIYGFRARSAVFHRCTAHICSIIVVLNAFGSVESSDIQFHDDS